MCFRGVCQPYIVGNLESCRASLLGQLVGLRATRSTSSTSRVSWRSSVSSRARAFSPSSRESALGPYCRLLDRLLSLRSQLFLTYGNLLTLCCVHLMFGHAPLLQEGPDVYPRLF